MAALTEMAAPILPWITPTTVALWLGALNLIAFAAFGFDKMQARNGWQRTPESSLLLYALLGGTPGAYAGRQLFRHKTRKQPFSTQLHLIALLQMAGAAALYVYLR